MSSRRFRDWSKQSSDTSEAELAHKNLVAINADLQRQIAMLENSTSLRVGRLILRILQPAFRLLRIRRFSNKAPTVEIDSTWPRLRGTITLHQATADLIPVRASSSTEELLNEAIDPQEILSSSSKGPWQSHFEFCYPLGFTAFDASELTVDVGGVESRGLHHSDSTRRGSGICRPIDIAVDSTLEVRGDPARIRSKLRTDGSVAILSTYRSKERVSGVPDRLVAELRSQGFAIVAVDTSNDLPELEMDVDLLIHRRNVGWDFASWMSTLASFPWMIEESKRLLLINDSNVGPLASLAPIFERGQKLGFDVWGLTDSWDIAYHLQSYFLCFESSALRSGRLSQFVEAFTFPSVKDRIIGSGEIGLSQFLIGRGLRLGALFPYEALARTFIDSFSERVSRLLELPENRFQAEHAVLSDNAELNFLLDTIERVRSSAPVNPTHFFWDILLNEGSPFIKRDLLMKNPDRVAGLHRLPGLVRNESARAVLDAELQMWSRSHPDLSLPLAFRWNPGL